MPRAPTQGFRRGPAPARKPLAKAAEARGIQQPLASSRRLTQSAGPHCMVSRGPSLSPRATHQASREREGCATSIRERLEPGSGCANHGAMARSRMDPPATPASVTLLPETFPPAVRHPANVLGPRAGCRELAEEAAPGCLAIEEARLACAQSSEKRAVAPSRSAGGLGGNCSARRQLP